MFIVIGVSVDKQCEIKQSVAHINNQVCGDTVEEAEAWDLELWLDIKGLRKELEFVNQGYRWEVD